MFVQVLDVPFWEYFIPCVVGFNGLVEKVGSRLERPKTKYSSRNQLHRRMLVLKPIFKSFVTGSKRGSCDFFFCRVCKRDVKWGPMARRKSFVITSSKNFGNRMWSTAFIWVCRYTISWWSRWLFLAIRRTIFVLALLLIWAQSFLSLKICCPSMRRLIQRCLSWPLFRASVTDCGVAAISLSTASVEALLSYVGWTGARIYIEVVSLWDCGEYDSSYCSLFFLCRCCIWESAGLGCWFWGVIWIFSVPEFCFL